MKIYNKKRFASGVFMVGLGAVNLISDIATHNSGMQGIILAAALFLLGFSAIQRSLSKKLSLEDKLDNLDERNRLIELKSKSKSFRLTQGISFVFLILAIIAWKICGDRVFIGITLGLAFSHSVSIFAEIFTYAYYEERN